MPPPLSELNIVDWAEIFAAMGQCLSALGAFLAARYALLTVREMQRQGAEQLKLIRAELDRFEFINGPALEAAWSTTHPEEPQATHRPFPITENQVANLNHKDPEYRDAFEAMSKWWKDPASNPVPTKYVILKIHNSQSSPWGRATSIKGIIEVEIRNKEKGKHRYDTYRIPFEIPECEAHNTVSIPLRVEGMPYLNFTLTETEFISPNSAKVIKNQISGELNCCMGD